MERELLPILLYEVEQKMGRKMKSPKDFVSLLEVLPQQDMLSLSTLKRVWSYVPSQHVPRENTLSILARWVGYDNWNSFCQSKTNSCDSSFLDNTLCVADLNEGTEILLEWLPNRTCLVRKLADHYLLVVEASHCKLETGDVFSTVWLAVGHPLYATHLIRAGQQLPDYVAGRRQGLTKVSVMSQSKSI